MRELRGFETAFLRFRPWWIHRLDEPSKTAAVCGPGRKPGDHSTKSQCAREAGDRLRL